MVSQYNLLNKHTLSIITNSLILRPNDTTFLMDTSKGTLFSHILNQIPDLTTQGSLLPRYRKKRMFLGDFQHPKFRSDKYEAVKLLNLTSKMKDHCYFLNKENFLKVTEIQNQTSNENDNKNENMEICENNENKEVEKHQKESQYQKNENKNSDTIQKDSANPEQSEVEVKKPFPDPVSLIPFFKLDNVVLNCQSNLPELVQRLLPHMNPNCKLIVYSRYSRALNDLYDFLKQSKQFTMIHTGDYLIRQFQVFSMRTRPVMRAPLNDGCLLTAYRVVDSEPPVSN